mgnify:FL=1
MYCRNEEICENVRLTEHAYKRMKERLGYNRKTAERIAKRAIQCGVESGKSSGQLDKYIIHNEISEDRNVFVFGEAVYVYSKHEDARVLITVLHLPQALKNQARTVQNRMNKTKEYEYAM